MNPTDILFCNPCPGNGSVSWKVRSQAQCSFSCKQIIVTPFVVSPITHPLQDHYTSLFLHNRYSSLDSPCYTSGLSGLLTIKPCYPCWYFVGLYNTRGIPELERKYASFFFFWNIIPLQPWFALLSGKSYLTFPCLVKERNISNQKNESSFTADHQRCKNTTHLHYNTALTINSCVAVISTEVLWTVFTLNNNRLCSRAPFKTRRCDDS